MSSRTNRRALTLSKISVAAMAEQMKRSKAADRRSVVNGNIFDSNGVQFDCGDEFGLIPAAVGAYSENGPNGAGIDPRRVRLIARRR